MAKVTKKQCPVCAKGGRDKHKDNLCVYEDGSTFCFACGFYEQPAGVKSKVSYPKATTSCDYLLDKGIDSDTCDQWRVRVEVELLRDGSAEDTGIVVFPYFDETTLVGVKYRDRYAELYEGKKKSKTIWYDGEIDLYGLHMLTGKDDLVLAEGETDVLRLWSADKGGATKDFLGIPGTQHYDLLKKRGALLRKYKRVYICTDNDEAGRGLLLKAREILPAYLIRICDYAQFKVNDACELNGTQFDELYATAKQPLDSTLITGRHMRSMYHSYRADASAYDFLSTGYESLDALLGGGIRRNDMILLIGHTGVGKSQIAGDIMYNIIAQGDKKVMYIPTEMKTEQMLDRLVMRYAGKSDIRAVRPEKIEEAFDLIENSVIFYDLSHDIEDMTDAISNAIYAHNIEMVCIDVINDITNFGEWQATQVIMSKLMALVNGDRADKRPPIAILAVGHTKFTEGRFRQRLRRDSIAGGKVLGQKVTQIIGVEMDETDDDEQEDTYRLIRTIKPNRLRTSEIKSTQIRFNCATYRYTEVEAGSPREDSPNEGKSQLPLRTRKGRATGDNPLRSRLRPS